MIAGFCRLQDIVRNNVGECPAEEVAYEGTELARIFLETLELGGRHQCLQNLGQVNLCVALSTTDFKYCNLI